MSICHGSIYMYDAKCIYLGMLSRLQDGPSLAVAAMTITSARQKVVDFLHPFEDLGFTVVVQRDWANIHHQYKWKGGFSVFYPVEASVWVLTFFSILVVS